MNIYEVIATEINKGSVRPTDDEISEKYSDYPKEILTRALKYAHGVIKLPSTTEVIFHGDEVFFPPYSEEDYESFCHMTGGFHRHYWIDDDLSNHIGLADAMDELQRYLNANVKLPTPIFVCGGL